MTLNVFIAHSHRDKNIQKHRSDITIHVEYQIRLFCQSEFFNGFRKHKMLPFGEVLRNFFEKLTSFIGIVFRFDLVAYS